MDTASVKFIECQLCLYITMFLFLPVSGPSAVLKATFSDCTLSLTALQGSGIPHGNGWFRFMVRLIQVNGSG